MHTGRVKFYLDTLLIETALSYPKNYKKASFVEDLINKAKTYVEGKIDPNDRVGSALKLLAPGALFALMKGLGFGGWSIVLQILLDVLDIDLGGMLNTAYHEVYGAVSGDKKISPEEIDQITNSIAQEYGQDVQIADDFKSYSSLELFDFAKTLNSCIYDYDKNLFRLTKSSGLFSDSTKSSFKKRLGSDAKSKGSSLLATIIGWIIKVVFYSAGIMVIKDMVHSVTQTKQHSTAPQIPTSKSTQTKFKPKADESLPVEYPMVNNDGNISNMILQFAKDTYDGLDGKESIIENTPGFKAVKDAIKWNNMSNEGSTSIFIPNVFKSKKDMVDHFIDQVAKNS